MAVILNIDIPKDCYECILRYQAFCFDGHHEPHQDKSHCPLKSADEMIAEIERLKDTPHCCQHYERGVKNSLEVVCKYCDKEQEHEIDN